jgi:hypothetical protein
VALAKNIDVAVVVVGDDLHTSSEWCVQQKPVSFLCAIFQPLKTGHLPRQARDKRFLRSET